MKLTNSAELTCQEVVELLTELLGGALTPEARARLEQHILVCPPCTLHLSQLKATIALTNALGDKTEAPPPAVLAAFKRWKAK